MFGFQKAMDLATEKSRPFLHLVLVGLSVWFVFSSWFYDSALARMFSRFLSTVLRGLSYEGFYFRSCSYNFSKWVEDEKE